MSKRTYHKDVWARKSVFAQLTKEWDEKCTTITTCNTSVEKSTETATVVTFATENSCIEHEKSKTVHSPLQYTVNPEIFGVKIFSDTSKNPKIKNTKIF